MHRPTQIDKMKVKECGGLECSLALFTSQLIVVVGTNLDKEKKEKRIRNEAEGGHK